MSGVGEERMPQTCAEAAAASPFKVGDIVRLKSGGPQMVVVYVDGRSVDCMWFVDSALESDEFPNECVVAGGAF